MLPTLLSKDQAHSDVLSWILTGSELFRCQGNVMLDQFHEQNDPNLKQQHTFKSKAICSVDKG